MTMRRIDDVIKGSHHTQVLVELATDHNIAVVSVQYRMYPDAKYPDYVVDSTALVYRS